MRRPDTFAEGPAAYYRAERRRRELSRHATLREAMRALPEALAADELHLHAKHRVASPPVKRRPDHDERRHAPSAGEQNYYRRAYGDAIRHERCAVYQPMINVRRMRDFAHASYSHWPIYYIYLLISMLPLKPLDRERDIIEYRIDRD